MEGQSNERSAFEIAGESIPPGERRTLAIPVSHQVTGFPANLALQVVHGANEGPSVFVSAAIHGDEIVGTAIIQRLIERIAPDRLAGTLMLAPAVNIFGFMQHDRYLPDRRDLNRSFPGSRKGSLAAQLAQCFLTHVIERCTLGIDLHTAAIHRYNLPQIRIAAGDPTLVELAMAFGAPVIMESPLRPGSMRALAAEREVPMLLMEAGEALRFDRLSIDIGASGIARVLAHIGMIAHDDSLTSVGIPARSNESSWVRAPRGGVTHRDRKSGDVVHAGDVLATVTGLFGEDGREMVAPFGGIIIGHSTLPVVNQGDAVFHIAKVDRPLHAGERIESITEAIRMSEPAGPAKPMMDEDEVL
ncbi:MAG: succinylglutamate desuccinylase/aspartoacylase family protein [Erythrobacter sp.]|uniref:succinylglutamate desuccinylase/aspartoacylase family protein n=1 Tax=Erythrobacter sp. TaxID=1042 RepID=UPI003C77BCEB